MNSFTLVLKELKAPERSSRLDLPAASFGSGIHVLVGPNGAGKTTLLRAIAEPDFRSTDSTVELRGAEGVGPVVAPLKISSLPQAPSLPRNLRVEEVLSYAAYVRDADRASTIRISEALGLSELNNRKTTALSGGEFLRLNLAVAMTGDPHVLLLDEPTAALDPPARQNFMSLVREASEPSTVIIVSTHSGRDVAQSDCAHLMDAGAVRWSGNPTDFLAFSPDQDFEDAFVSVLSTTRNPK